MLPGCKPLFHPTNSTHARTIGCRVAEPILEGGVHGEEVVAVIPRRAGHDGKVGVDAPVVDVQRGSNV
jgi:hypothetical protein